MKKVDDSLPIVYFCRKYHVKTFFIICTRFPKNNSLKWAFLDPFGTIISKLEEKMKKVYGLVNVVYFCRK